MLAWLSCFKGAPYVKQPTNLALLTCATVLQYQQNYFTPSQLQVLSDIHLEFKRSRIDFPVTAPYLCLLGDIGDPGTESIKTLYMLRLNDLSKCLC